MAVKDPKNLMENIERPQVIEGKVEVETKNVCVFFCHLTSVAKFTVER